MRFEIRTAQFFQQSILFPDAAEIFQVFGKRLRRLFIGGRQFLHFRQADFFDLAHPFAANFVAFADCFKGFPFARFQTETALDNLALLCRKLGQQFLANLLVVDV